MAFRLSDRDRAASQAAAAIRQANRAQADYDALMPQAMAKISQAQQGPSNPLESVLSGIGNSVKNVGKGLGDLFTSGAISAYAGTGLKSLFEGKSYAQAAREANRDVDDFKKRYYNTDSLKDAYAKSGGTALDAAATLSDLIPGLGKGAKVALNVGQGVASGIANPFIEKGSQATLEDVMKGAAVGGASAGVGQYVGGKLANRTAGKGIVSKALNSNIGKGAITGGLAGATGGGLYSALNGGDVVSGALQGLQGGATSGATMAGMMGLLGSGIDKINKKYGDTTPDAQAARKVPQVDDVEQLKPATIEAALQEAQAPTRRKIAVQYNGEAEPVEVARGRKGEYMLPERSGSTLDGILSPDNETQLPNAKKPTYKADALTVVNSGKMAEPIDTLKRMGVSDDTINALKDAAGIYQRDIGGAALQAYGLDGKGDLPMLNREQYYRDNMGQLAANGGNGNIRAEDVEDYMYGHLRNSAGQNSLGGSQDDNWTILRNLLGERAKNMSLDDMYDAYRTLARSASMSNSDTYSPENIAGALAMDDRLNKRLSQEMYDRLYPATKIDVEGQAPLAQRIDVTDRDQGKLIQDVMPGKRQAQPVAQQTETQPTQRVRRSADTSGINVAPGLDPSDVARLERQLTVNRQKQGSALLDQYGTLDAPVRRALGSPEDVLTTLYDDYGLKTPADVQYAANHVTGRDGVVSQMTRELAGSAKNVDTTISRQWLQDMMDLNGLTDDEQKVVVKQLSGALKRGGESVDGNTALDVMKQLEKQSARYKGKDGTYHHGTESEGRKAIALDLVHDELQDRLWDAAGDPKKVLTSERITQLKNMYKDNGAWADFIDNRLAKSTSGAELRSAMKPLVDGAKIVYGSKQSAGGFADKAYKAATSANPVVAMGQMAYDAALGSDKVKQARAQRYANKASSAKAQLTGQEAPTNKSGIVGAAKAIGKKAINKAGEAADMLNNDTFSSRAISPIERNGQTQTIGDIATRQLSRQAGLGAMQQQDRNARIQDAMQEAQGIQSNYNNAMANAQQMYNQASQQTASTSALDRIATAMDAALAAGDINSYSQLANLYKQAYNIYGLQNPTSQTESKSLSANQSKALSGLQQLQDLQAMQPSARTALANSPLSGLVDITGGDDYANQAKSLALTLGYLQSGANITPREAENIGKAYIPSALDSEQVRQNKLSRAEQLLRNYLADSSALQ